MEFYREKLDEDLDIEHLSNSDLDTIIREVIRTMTYNYILFGKDITYDMFIENINIYLNMIDRIEK